MNWKRNMHECILRVRLPHGVERTPSRTCVSYVPHMDFTWTCGVDDPPKGRLHGRTAVRTETVILETVECSGSQAFSLLLFRDNVTLGISNPSW